MKRLGYCLVKKQLVSRYFYNEINRSLGEDILNKRKEYFKNFLDFVEVLKLRIQNKYDNVIAVTGVEGVGKSTIAYWIARLMEGKNFDFKKNYVYEKDLNVIIEKLQDKKIKVIVDDEAIRRFYKLEWYKPYQIRLNQLYAIARKFRTTTILCLPRFHDFNEFFRNHRINFWIHVLSRGVAVLFGQDWSPFNKDPWWLDVNQKRVEKLSTIKKLISVDIDFKLRVLKTCKNFLAILCFPPMPDEDQAKYDEIIATIEVKNLVEEEKEESEKENPLLKKYKESILKTVKFLKMQQGYSNFKISMITGLAQSTISSLLRSDKDYNKFLQKEREEREREKMRKRAFQKLPFV
ncbi:MAG: hypothetical protein QXO00_05000 [Candidatus Bathyarchaeia archaeon]